MRIYTPVPPPADPARRVRDRRPPPLGAAPEYARTDETEWIEREDSGVC